MNLQQSQYSVTKVLTFTDSVKGFLEYNNLGSDDAIGSVDSGKIFVNYEVQCNGSLFLETYTLGGILSNVNYMWLSNGSRLVVVNSQTGAKLAAWNFGAVLRDSYTCVTCVVDLHNSNSKYPLLVIGLQSGLTRGMICIFDITNSKVVRAIQIDKQVSSQYIL